MHKISWALGMSSKKWIVMVGPSISSHGGIASVVLSWKQAGLFELWPIIYLETHIEGSKFDKLRVACSAMVKFLFLLASNRVACLHIHVARRTSFWRKSVFALAAFALRRPVLLHLHSGGFPAFQCVRFRFRCGKLHAGRTEQRPIQLR